MKIHVPSILNVHYINGKTSLKLCRKMVVPEQALPDILGVLRVNFSSKDA